MTYTTRLVAAGDEAEISDYYSRNFAHFKPWQPTRPPGFDSLDNWKARLPKILTLHEERQAAFFVIEHSGVASQSIVGHCSLSQIYYGPFCACYLGYGLDEKNQGRGIMSASLQQVIGFAFDQLRLHRIMANYMPHNLRSAAVLKGLGFKIEGKAEKYLAIDGQWQDHILTSLTNHQSAPDLFL